jgi:hypothetical protein
MTLTTSDLYILYIHGKLRRKYFQRNQSHGQLKLESSTIIETRLFSKTFLVLRYLFWADGPYIELKSVRDMS